MTNWIPYENFKKRKGEHYLFYHPPVKFRDAPGGLKAWYNALNGKPDYPRKPTFYAVITAPISESNDEISK